MSSVNHGQTPQVKPPPRYTNIPSITSTPTTSKRRRVDTANATLRKPFRSPLLDRDIVSSASPSALAGAKRVRGDATPSLQKTQAVDAETGVAGCASPWRKMVRLEVERKSEGSPTDFVRNSKNGLSARRMKLNETDDKDGEEDLLLRLDRHQKAIQAQLKAVRQERELAAQAARIEKQSRKAQGGTKGYVANEELRDLVGKWKGASRMAAEELFELIKGRVEGMGGVKAWRESSRGRGGWDDDYWRRQRKDEREVEDEEDLVKDEEQEDEWRHKEGEGDEGNDFSMAMMLRSLNVEIDVLGWHPEEDKWTN